MSKIFTGTLQQNLNPAYAKAVPATQCGAVSQCGTDFAHQMATTTVEAAQLRNRSLFLLFLDLEKAFDLVVREFVVGMPQGFSGDSTMHLQGLGLPFEEARKLADELEEDDTLLRRMGVDECVAELVRALHSRAWARVGQLSSVLGREEDVKGASSEP